MRSVRKSQKQQPESTSMLFDLLVIIKGSIISVIFTLVSFLIFALVIKIAGLQETIIAPANQVIRVLSIAIGAFYAARASKKNGWLKGALTGVMYIVWAILISSLFGGNIKFDMALLSDAGLGLIVGAIGGIIGVNVDK